MNAVERREAADVVETVLVALSKTVVQVGRTASAMRLQIGDIIADDESLVQDGEIAAPLANAFDLARQSGASFDSIDRVRQLTEAIVTVRFAATSVKNLSIRLSLVQMAKILASTTFTSRPEVDRYIDRVNSSFELAEEVAGNSLDNEAYRSIISLHAAVTNDLVTRARPLPTIVLFDFASNMPALWISNRLYGGADRTNEVIKENKPIHPAFMSSVIRALSR